MGKNTIINKPIISAHRGELPRNIRVDDNFENSLIELFYIRNPQHSKKNPPKHEIEQFINKQKNKKVYIYYPWSRRIISTIKEDEYFEIRTARNKSLITKAQQKKFRNLTIGVAGLSIGSSAINFISTSGGAKKYKLADFDTIEVSNLNRMRASLLDVGENKARIAARNIWAIDPFAEIDIWDKGINEHNIKDFLQGGDRIDVLIDAIDDLPLKVMIRRNCKKNKIPVLMATSNGDSIIVDIERYDLSPNLEIFNGRISGNPNDYHFNDYSDWLRLANKIVDSQILSPKMKKIIPKIGKTLAGVPQLSTTVNFGGIVLSKIIRDIASDKMSHKSGRNVYKLP